MKTREFYSLSQKFFDTINLYLILGLQSDANLKQVTQAYRRMSLKHHPDKVCEDERQDAVQRFLVINQVYHILSNPERRAAYDDTGLLDSEEESWFSGIFFNDLPLDRSSEFYDQVKKGFQGSQEEEDEIIRLFTQFNGSMSKIIEHLEWAKADDEPRILEILHNQIETGRLQDVTGSVFGETPEQTYQRRCEMQKQEQAEEMRFEQR